MQEAVQSKAVSLEKVDTEKNLADMNTKYQSLRHRVLMAMLGFYLPHDEVNMIELGADDPENIDDDDDEMEVNAIVEAENPQAMLRYRNMVTPYVMAVETAYDENGNAEWLAVLPLGLLLLSLLFLVIEVIDKMMKLRKWVKALFSVTEEQKVKCAMGHTNAKVVMEKIDGENVMKIECAECEILKKDMEECENLKAAKQMRTEDLKEVTEQRNAAKQVIRDNNNACNTRIASLMLQVQDENSAVTTLRQQVARLQEDAAQAASAGASGSVPDLTTLQRPRRPGDVLRCASCNQTCTTKRTQSNARGNQGRLYTKCPGCQRFDWHEARVEYVM